MRILVIEDDPDIGKAIKTSLEERCFAVDLEPDGERGSWMARTNDYDLLILDNMLPGKQGRDICKELREFNRKVPIIMLTVQSDVANKIEMLNLGADDYLTKPFSFGELIARIQAILRRPQEMKGDMLVLDDLAMDLQKQEVRRGKENIYLTRKEFQLLEYMLRNAKKVVSRGMILEHVWDETADPFSNTIETHILNLRRKVDKGRKKKLIQTVPGRGYKIDVVK